jgi:serine/threonine-protein kinase
LLTYLVVALAIGFPVVVGLAWIFDVNQGHIERTGATAGLGSGRLVAILAGISVVSAAPGVAWYLWLRKPALPAAVPAAPGPSIAVLPLVNMSSDKEQEYFSDGLTEELLNLLAKVPGLQVAARTSSFAFKGKNTRISEIGQELGVATLLEGSVRKSGDQVRITTQLINAADGYHLWSETYDRKLTDIFAVQDEIARAVVGALKLKLLPGQQPDTQGLRAQNPDAYLSYLEGLQLLSSFHLADYQKAVEAFERSRDLEPGFGPAWAGLGYARIILSFMGGPALTARSDEETEKAIALAPGLPLAWSARSMLRTARFDWAGSRADVERALSLSPGDPLASTGLARFQVWTGQFKEGLDTLQRALERDPLNPVVVHDLASAYLFEGDLVRARQVFDRRERLGSPQADGDDWPGYLLILEGKPQEALEAAGRRPLEVWRLVGTAMAQHALGNDPAARAALARLHDPQFARPFSVQVAQLHAMLGEKDEAFAALERAYEFRDVGMLRLKADPLLRKLAGDPRYGALLVRLKLPAE